MCHSAQTHRFLRKGTENGRGRGFTLIEMLIGSAIMLFIIVATLAVYTRSNKTAVDQQQYADLQNDVRSSMFFLNRDIRSAGVGLGTEVKGYFIEGYNENGPAPESADSIRLMGNYDDQLGLRIENYQGGAGGGAATATLFESELLNAPYACPEFFENKSYLIVSMTCPNCFAFRYVGANMVFGCGGGAAHFNMTHGSSEMNPPGGLVDVGCSDDCYDNAIVTFGQLKLYWLDTTGELGNIQEISLTPGQNGYLGEPNILYLTTVGNEGTVMHLPLARNIENLQFQYNGDFDNDKLLDGFQDWDNANWSVLDTDSAATREAKLDIISRLQEVRIWVVGKTARPYVAVSGQPPAGVYHYRRPGIADTDPGSNDNHRRFVLESTASVRNMILNLYNEGER